MPAPLVHVGAVILCPHGGMAQVVTSNVRTLLQGQPAAALADTYPIGGCTFYIGNAYHPCVLVRWLTPAVKVLVNGQPAILQSSTGICLAADQAPQGPASILATQPNVIGI